MKKKYLVAVSGGPDSMALLDMKRASKDFIEVAHVNYHKRDSAKNDEKIVKDYCKKYGIKFYKLDVDPNSVKGNFQAYARKARYEFFAKICNSDKLDGVLVAHHKDDLIETYLMQKEKNIGVNTYGLSSDTNIYGVRVLRPLLKYTKKQLIDYCDKNNIIYGIDESNLTNSYTRNKIRHTKVDKMSDIKKDKIVKEIDKKNAKYEQDLDKAISHLNHDGVYKTNEFIKIPNIKLVLRLMFKNKSDKYFDEMLRQLKTSKSCCFTNDLFYVTKEYDHILTYTRPIGYSYTFKNMKALEKFKCDYFKITKKGTSFEGVTVTNKDFPITIRNINKNDSIQMTYGKKKLNRFFIDNKIYSKDRMNWPIVVNCDGIAILVPELGCDLKHYSKSHNMFCVKIK